MRTDLILSTPTGRCGGRPSHLVVAVVGTGILMLATGLGVGLRPMLLRRVVTGVL